VVKNTNKLYSIKVPDTSIEPLIKRLADDDMRTIGNEAAYLIRKEYAKRFPGSITQESKPEQKG
jgi:hypothetical protein